MGIFDDIPGFATTYGQNTLGTLGRLGSGRPQLRDFIDPIGITRGPVGEGGDPNRGPDPPSGVNMHPLPESNDQIGKVLSTGRTPRDSSGDNNDQTLFGADVDPFSPGILQWTPGVNAPANDPNRGLGGWDGAMSGFGSLGFTGQAPAIASASGPSTPPLYMGMGGNGFYTSSGSPRQSQMGRY